MKTCNKCNRDLPISQFGKKGKSTQSMCKECHRMYSKQHYTKNRDYYVLKARKHTLKTRSNNLQLINEFKGIRGCRYCTECDPICLDFHHLMPTVLQTAVWNISPSKSGTVRNRTA